MNNSPPFFHIFILSFNRGKYIHHTIECILNQRFKDFTVTILDNASTDETESVVKKFPVTFFRQEKNVGVINNFLMANQHCQSDWLMVFHDDDLLHPDYLQHCYDEIIKDPELQFMGSNYIGIQAPSHNSWPKVHVESWTFRDQAHFASFCYTKNDIHFASAIYKREHFMKISNKFSIFGKICDRPILIEGMGNGKGKVFKYPFVQYRLHAGQDSQSATSGPFLNEAIALTRFYKSFMGTDWSTSSGKCFIINNRAYLKGLYKWCSDRQTMSFNKFIGKAIQEDAATVWSRLPRVIMRCLKKYYLKHDPLFF